MKKLNKKGFTLIELLAVIVVLAIIMVIAATQVGKAINNARKGSFESSYKMIVKEVKNRILQKDVDVSTAIECNDTGSPKCSSIYDISENDYEMVITESSGKYIISISGKGKFDGLDLSSIASDISDKASVVSGNSTIAMAINSAGKEVELTDEEKNQFLTQEQKDNLDFISSLNLGEGTTSGKTAAWQAICDSTNSNQIVTYSNNNITKVLQLLRTGDELKNTQIYHDQIKKLGENKSFEYFCYGSSEISKYQNIYECKNNGTHVNINNSSKYCFHE